MNNDMTISRSPPRDGRGRFARQGTQELLAEENVPMHDQRDQQGHQDDDLRQEVNSIQQGMQEMQQMMRLLLIQQQQQLRTVSPAIEHRAQRTPSPAYAHSPVPSIAPSQSESTESSVSKELLRLIPQYNGDGNKPHVLYEFIEKLELYFEQSEPNSETKLRLVISRFTGTAHIWWKTIKASNTCPTTWEELKRRLI
jgi:hypothetical protein